MDLYGKEAMITKELIQMNAEIKLNRNVEEILHDLAVRSGVEEIQSFAEILVLQKGVGRLPSDYPDNSSTHIRKDRSRERSGYSHCRKEAGGKDYECDAIFIPRLSESCIRRIYRSVVWQFGRCSCHECSIIGFVGAMAINRRISDIRV